MNKFCDFIEAIKPFTVISFDVFDTLIFRSVSKPRNIFEMVRVLFEEETGDSLCTFPLDRIYAECFARVEHKREVSLDEIYEYLNYSESRRERLKKLEEDCEIGNCIPNKVMVDVAQWCRDNGKKIAITSDMYLPRRVFDAILKKIGVSYDVLLISGEERCTKRQGLLFDVLLKRLGCQAQDVLHTGDDYYSDVLMPRKIGISSLERLLCEQRTYHPYQFDHSVYSDYLMTLSSKEACNLKEDSPEYRVGFGVIGPYLVSFCQWLHVEKERKCIDKLAFVAREGYLIKKIYEILYPEDNCVYIRLNKNLLRLPSQKNACDLKDFIRSLPPRKSMKWSDILTHFGIRGISQREKFFKENRDLFDLNVLVSMDDLKAGTFNKELNVIWSFQKENLREQTEYLLAYLKSNGFCDAKIGLVNNSMKGNGQFLLKKICQENDFPIKVHGLQFAAQKECRKKLGNMVSVFYDYKSKKRILNAYFCSFCLVFEHMLFESSGTARSFAKQKDGSIEVICDSMGKESENLPAKQKIQQFALKYASVYRENVRLLENRNNCDILLSFFKAPYKEDAALIGNFWDEDVERTRRINEKEEKLKRISLFCLHKPASLGWPEGYLAENNSSNIVLRLYYAKKILLLYLHNKDAIVPDIVFGMKKKIQAACCLLFVFGAKMRGFLFLRYFKVKAWLR